MSEFTIFDENPFQITIIDIGKVFHLEHNNPNYVDALVSMPFVRTELIKNPKLFFEDLYNYLDIKNNPNAHVITKTIGEEKDYIYQMMFIESNFNKNELELNEFGSLLDVENEIIKGPIVLVKSFVPSLSNEMKFVDMTKNELHKLLRSRGYTKVVIYDGDDSELREEEFYGDVEKFAEKFFEGEYYKKKELAFLAHNINIYYTISEYGTKDKCGKLVEGNIDKYFAFTMLTNNNRGNLTKDELKKILILSEHLEPPYKTDDKWSEEDKDEFGRKIIKNKFRILDNIYEEIINKK